MRRQSEFYGSTFFFKCLDWYYGSQKPINPFTKRHISRLVQTESICRRQNKCYLQTEIHFGMCKKHCGKRRKCWLPAFSPFPSIFSKGFLFTVVKSRDYVVQITTQDVNSETISHWRPHFSLSHYHTMPHFDALKIYSCRKHCEKMNNCL